MEKRWVVPHTGKHGPCGTESLSVQVRNGPASRKLPLAHSRNSTFLGVGVSAAPSLAGVRRMPATATAGGGFPASTSCPNETPTCRETGTKFSVIEKTGRRLPGILIIIGVGERENTDKSVPQLFKSCFPPSDLFRASFPAVWSS